MEEGEGGDGGGGREKVRVGIKKRKSWEISARGKEECHGLLTKRRLKLCPQAK